MTECQFFKNRNAISDNPKYRTNQDGVCLKRGHSVWLEICESCLFKVSINYTNNKFDPVYKVVRQLESGEL